MRRLFTWILSSFLLTLALAHTTYAAPARFSFAVFGDNQPERTTLAQPEIFKQILDDINSAHPDFVISTGDTICGSADFSMLQVMYNDYADTVSLHLKAKLYQAVGNHDIYGSKRNQWFFKSKLKNLYQSFDHGDSHFIVLDSEVVGEEGRIAGDQLKWLRTDLYNSRNARNKFIFVHRPLFPVSGHIGSSLDTNLAERDGLHQLFRTYKVTAVFSGHEHLFNTEIRNGIRYVISGGAGGRLYPSFFGTGDFHHYVMVTVTADKVGLEVVRTDRGEMTRKPIP